MTDKNIIPPQNIPAEESLLGTILMHPDSIHQVSEVISNPDMLYLDKNKKVYTAIIKQFHSGKTIDVITISSELKESGQLEAIGGRSYLASLMMPIVSEINVNQYAILVYDAYIRRELIKLSGLMQKQAYDESNEIDIEISLIQDSLIKLTNIDVSKIETIETTCQKVRETIKLNLKTEEGNLSGIPSGFIKYDRHTGGFQSGDLIIIAAETSQGKTTLALNMIFNSAMISETPTAIYSLEMTSGQCTSRLIASESGISSKRITSTRLSDIEVTQIEKSIGKIESLPIYFDDESTSSIQKIMNSIRAMKTKFGIKLVMVDYLQLIRHTIKGGSREQVVGEVTRMLKNIAKELNITIILLSQLSRSDNPFPTMNRLRDSGQIEEAADMVILIFRPEYYLETGKMKFAGYPEPFENIQIQNTAQIIISKGRNCGVTQFILSFDKDSSRFYDYEEGTIYKQVQANMF